MNCEEVRELLPAYVLGALDADDLEAVETHLRAGREHEDELVELSATVIALDRFGEDPGVDLSLATARRRAEAAAAIGRPKRRAIWPLAVAAAVLIAVFGAGWLAAELTGGGEGGEVSILVQGSEGRYVALQSAGPDAVTVTMEGFGQLSDAQAYQVWAIRDGQWLRIGVCNTNADGWWQGDFAFEVRPGERIALTIEPDGGSQTPTSEPLLTSSS